MDTSGSAIKLSETLRDHRLTAEELLEAVIERPEQVAATLNPIHLASLDQHDITCRISLLRLNSRPQSGESTTHDHQVCVGAADQLRLHHRSRGTVQPERE